VRWQHGCCCDMRMSWRSIASFKLSCMAADEMVAGPQLKQQQPVEQGQQPG
jgi:hypothetical protein